MNSEARGSSLDFYVQEIAKIPLLSREDEVRLGKRSEEGYKRMVYFLCDYRRRQIKGTGILKYELRKTLKKDDLKALVEKGEGVLEDGRYSEFLKLERRIKNDRARKRKIKPEVYEERMSETYERVFELVYGALPTDSFKAMMKQLSFELEREMRINTEKMDRTKKKKEFYQGKNDELEKVRSVVEKLLDEDRKIKSELIRSNLRFVLVVAKKYYDKNSHLPGIEYLDLVQEGNGGLIKAADMFDYRRGYKFLSYAVWRIRQRISTSLSKQARFIKISDSVRGIVNEYNKTWEELVKELGREPNRGELAERMKIDITELEMRLEGYKEPFSLDVVVEENLTPKDILEDSRDISPDDFYERKCVRELVLRALSGLLPRQERIVRMRFGIGERKSFTLREVGEELGLTRERIRQIQKKAQEELRVLLEDVY